jgi:putative hydrolase of HD superfamily
MAPDDVDRFLTFFRSAEALKDTLRSARTSSGRPESTAEHTWRLCLMALALADELPGIDIGRLLALLVVHDLAEAVGGDIPAPHQTGDKTDGERADLARLLEPLPGSAAARLSGLWEEYAAVATPEARLAKGLDRLETVLQHTQGSNPPDFDHGFNLGYGREHTDRHPVVAALRRRVDVETARLASARLIDMLDDRERLADHPAIDGEGRLDD